MTKWVRVRFVSPISPVDALSSQRGADPAAPVFARCQPTSSVALTLNLPVASIAAVWQNVYLREPSIA